MNIYEFEEKYKDILNNIDEWAYLRVPLGNIFHNEIDKNLQKEKLLQKIFIEVKKIKFIFYGFRNWFRKYDGLFFTDTAERRLLNGKYIDKISDDIIKRLGNNDILMIELANPSHYPKDDIVTKHIVSQSIIDLLSKILKLFFLKRLKSFNDLDIILQKEKINFNYSSLIISFNISYKIYKTILRIYNPKYIFVNCHYCRFPLIKAANDLKIKIIEVQHGVINQIHYAYSSEINLNKSYLPEYLLSFSKKESKINNKLISKIYPIGSFYLEYIDNNFKKNINLVNLTKKYKYTIGVSLQEQQEWELNLIFNFMIKCAEIDSNILYLMIPRLKEEFDYKLPDNMIIYNDLDCYNTILHCNIHTTLYSSCALEAPSLGIPNILIDVKGFATRYYKDILSSQNSIIVSDTKCFTKASTKLLVLKKEFIQKENEEIFVQNYSRRIEKFLKGELQK